jgi:hypothetical protein
MHIFKPLKFIALFAFVSGFSLSACFDDSSDSSGTKDCSVIARCEGEPELEIRLRQVETFYFEDATDDSSRFADLARFDYNEVDQWVGGDTTRVAESDFEYVIDYDTEGRMSKSTRTYYDDDGNTADLVLDYFYDGSSLLDLSESATVIKDSNNNLIKTINEVIDYTFSSGVLIDIHFDVDDSDEGLSDFHYGFTYENNLITEIHKTQQSNGDPNHVFKSFEYDEQSRVYNSKTFRLDAADQSVEQENIIYEYYEDGPLKTKTSIINSTPKQKIITHYLWEEGVCAFNQTFGDRLFPTPDVPNFPCF